jgi:hypothetical protein
MSPKMLSALYVQANGCYAGLPGVDCWPVERDAREYDGPWPVVAHPECKRWGRFYHGSTRKPFQYELGDDGGCFMSALISVHLFGGVIEHPAGSRAFAQFGLPIPKPGDGWSEPDEYGSRSCYVEQGHYGHPARKATWLYAIGVEFPELVWAVTRAQVPQWMIDRYGEKKARKIGVVAMMGGKDKERNRQATPPRFRDVLISIARTATGGGDGR